MGSFLFILLPLLFSVCMQGRGEREIRTQTWSPRWPHYQHLFRLSLQITHGVCQDAADTAQPPRPETCPNPSASWCLVIREPGENRLYCVRLWTYSWRMWGVAGGGSPGQTKGNANVTQWLTSFNRFDLWALKGSLCSMQAVPPDLLTCKPSAGQNIDVTCATTCWQIMIVSHVLVVSSVSTQHRLQPDNTLICYCKCYSKFIAHFQVMETHQQGQILLIAELPDKHIQDISQCAIKKQRRGIKLTNGSKTQTLVSKTRWKTDHSFNSKLWFYLLQFLLYETLVIHKCTVHTCFLPVTPNSVLSLSLAHFGINLKWTEATKGENKGSR